MAKLTVNFVDTSRGTVIPNLDVEFLKINDGNWESVAKQFSDLNGDAGISSSDVGGDLSGYYEVVARVGDYFMAAGYALPTLKFVDVLPLRFGVDDPDVNTSITISITPYGYAFQAK